MALEIPAPLLKSQLGKLQKSVLGKLRIGISPTPPQYKAAWTTVPIFNICPTRIFDDPSTISPLLCFQMQCRAFGTLVDNFLGITNSPGENYPAYTGVCTV